MLSKENLREISDIFIGDTAGLYPYKRGEDIVNFFNNEFGYHDKYGAGAPSRWMMVRDKLIDMIEKETINHFFNLVLSLDYIKKETEMSLVESADRAGECYQIFKDIVNRDSYDIVKNGENYFFVCEDEDQELIGEGGFANVYYQHSTGLVIKKLKPSFLIEKSIRSRFKREYEITNSLDGVKGIIKVFDFNEKNYSYTMEKADYTLETYMNKFPLEEKHKIIIINKILSIMKEVHSKKIIHRDLSPNNIFVINKDIIIADFGLGKDLTIIHSHQTKYTNGYGQYSYCAPEQLRSLKNADKRSDVYSLGKIINFVMSLDPEDNHHLFRIIAEKATQHDPNNRFEDAEQMLAKLNSYIKLIQNKEYGRKIKEKISMRKYDLEVEEFIYNMNPTTISKWIMTEEKGFLIALIRFMSKDSKNAESVINDVENTYQDVCGKSFVAYDPFAVFVKEILTNSTLTIAYEKAASILSYIAYIVGRFSAKNYIEELEKSGVDPYIQAILHEHD